ncbi:unnamed protein product [Eruca vesicaria subsp. sativa]|uniref:Uncharacterized protein n=1 Tax=Eruca vesicaria subsp. sativa TaxID=29727 RepID=A0ABC8L8C0_ERUVS|nr:unnamed protein product [Eruca vesicaria subsp. sativa]
MLLPHSMHGFLETSSSCRGLSCRDSLLETLCTKAKETVVEKGNEVNVSEVFHVSKPPLAPKGPCAQEKKRGNTMRSKSPLMREHQGESEGVSFGDMTTFQWDMFLQSFQTLLQDALSKRLVPSLGK